MDPESVLSVETQGQSKCLFGGASSTGVEIGVESASTDEPTETQTSKQSTDDDNENYVPDKAKKRRLSESGNDLESNGELNELSAKRKVPNDHLDSKLLNLSDEVLLDILKYLDSISLERLGL